MRAAKLSLNLRKLLFPGSTDFDDVIFAGAQFHDIGKGIEPHEETGYAVVRHILKEYCSSEELDNISEIVRCHCKRMIPNDKVRFVESFVERVKNEADGGIVKG